MSDIHTIAVSEDMVPVVLNVQHQSARTVMEIPVSESVLDGQYW